MGFSSSFCTKERPLSVRRCFGTEGRVLMMVEHCWPAENMMIAHHIMSLCLRQIWILPD